MSLNSRFQHAASTGPDMHKHLSCHHLIGNQARIVMRPPMLTELLPLTVISTPKHSSAQRSTTGQLCCPKQGLTPAGYAETCLTLVDMYSMVSCNTISSSTRQADIHWSNILGHTCLAIASSSFCIHCLGTASTSSVEHKCPAASSFPVCCVSAWLESLMPAAEGCMNGEGTRQGPFAFIAWREGRPG